MLRIKISVPGTVCKLVLAIILLSLIGCKGHSNTVVAIAIDPKRPDILYVATNDRVHKSRDAGKTWTVITEGLGAARVISLAIHPVLSSTIYAGTMGDSVYRSLDGGQRWSIINAGMKEHVSVVNALDFLPEDPETIFAALTVGIFKSTNGGLMWEEMSNKGMDSVYVVSLIIDQANHNNTLYAGTSGGVYRSLKGGQRWELIYKGMLEQDFETGLALGVNTLVQDPNTPSILYAGSTRGAYKTTNRGNTWTKITGGLSDGFIASMVLDTEDSHVLYAGTSHGIFKSHDGGMTWKTINEGLTNLTVRCLTMHPKDHQILYACTHGGPFKTVDGGTTWKELNLMNMKEN
jgi:photosystem II stability/assembly factor-like uncharacterized protein